MEVSRHRVGAVGVCDPNFHHARAIRLERDATAVRRELRVDLTESRADSATTGADGGDVGTPGARVLVAVFASPRR